MKANEAFKEQSKILQTSNDYLVEEHTNIDGANKSREGWATVYFMRKGLGMLSLGNEENTKKMQEVKNLLRKERTAAAKFSKERKGNVC